MDKFSVASGAIESSISLKSLLLRNRDIIEKIVEVCDELVRAFRQDKKALLCGNGGSAADAQHIAAELSGKFYLDRAPLFAEALHGNTSYLTAVANDYSFDEIFARLVRAKGRERDVLIGISTSGKSRNVINALEAANEIGMVTVGLTGASGGNMAGLCKYLVQVPSIDTPRIQEAHILIGHVICEIVEKELFSGR